MLSVGEIACMRDAAVVKGGVVALAGKFVDKFVA
jgi:hypothetical protein